MIKLLRNTILYPFSFWRLNLLVWIAFNSITLFIRYESHLSLWVAFTASLYLLPIEFILSSILHKIYRSWLVDGLLQVKTSCWVLVLSFLASAIEAFLSVYILEVNAGWYSHAHWSLFQGWTIRTIVMGIVYLEWSLGYFGIRAEIKAHEEELLKLEAQGEAQRLELQLLRNQLDPHFLFNSLNGIATEIETAPKVAVGMVHELADYLRYSLEHRDSLLSPFSVELHAVSLYLRIEKIRFGERLQINTNIDEQANEKMVPSFLLQPLIENAVKYGFSSASPPWRLAICATVRDSVLRIEVCNTGTIAGEVRMDGVGHKTIKRRLELHYPQRHLFALEERDGLVCVVIELKGDPCLLTPKGSV